MPDFAADAAEKLTEGTRYTDGFPLIFGMVTDFRPTVKELKVFD